MPGAASKSKGAGFERQVCQQLSLWVSAGARRDCFWRSAMSGGRATVHRRQGVLLGRQAGDITATAPEGHSLTDQYFIECKFYRTLRLELFLFYGSGPLAQFWRRTAVEADRYGKVPFLIAKQNRLPSLVVLPWGAQDQLTQHSNTIASLRVTRRDYAIDLFVCFLDDFLRLTYVDMEYPPRSHL